MKRILGTVTLGALCIAAGCWLLNFAQRFVETQLAAVQMRNDGPLLYSGMLKVIQFAEIAYVSIAVLIVGILVFKIIQELKQNEK